jgi:hypothetical protein
MSNYRKAKSNTIHLFGDWNGQLKKVKGINQRSMKPIMERLASVEKDQFMILLNYAIII